MGFNYNKCPDCGYTNINRPDICPSCGYNLKEYRTKLKAEEERLALEAKEKARLDALEKSYTDAVNVFKGGLIGEAQKAFLALDDYKDSKKYVEKCIDAFYQKAIDGFYNNPFLCAIKPLLGRDKTTDEEEPVGSKSIEDVEDGLTPNDLVAKFFSSTLEDEILGIKESFYDFAGYKDSDAYQTYCDKATAICKEHERNLELDKAKTLFSAQRYDEAKTILTALGSFKDAETLLVKVNNELNRISAERNAAWNAQYAAKQRRNAIKTLFQVIALLSPIVMTIVFAVILFKNKEQISIVSSFGGWCTGWVFFMIGSLIASIVLLIKRVSKWSVDNRNARTASTVVAIVVIICSIIVFVNSAKLDTNFDPTTFVTIEVMGKTTQRSGGTALTFNESTISFKLTNKSNITVNYVGGEIVFYNGSTQVGSQTIYFNEEYKAGQTYYTSIPFTEINEDALYKTPYEDLTVTFRICSMRFNGDYDEYRYNGKTITIKQGGSNPTNSTAAVQETKYQQALALYNQGKYAEAFTMFQSLGSYKESDSYSKECESKQFYSTMESELHRVAGSEAILPDNYEVYTSYTADYQLYYYGESSYDEENHIYTMERPFICFLCDLRVPSSEKSNYLSNFINKLKANGFVYVKTNTYRKGTTFVQFSDIQGGYINYYAFINPTPERIPQNDVNHPTDDIGKERI